MFLLLLACLVLSLAEAAPRGGSGEGAYCEVVLVTTTMDQSTMTSRVSTESTPTAEATGFQKIPLGSESNVWTGMTRPASSTWTASTTTTSPMTSASSSTASSTASISPQPKTKKKSVLYFTNWSIYNNFTLSDISFKHVTHLLYSFASIKPDASLSWTDENADTLQILDPIQKREQSVVHGNIGQLFELKKKYRSLKTLLSVGGASHSKDGIFTAASRTMRGRKAFANSVVKVISEYGFDGLDLDWEFPDSEEAENFLALVKQVRKALDKYARQNDQDYHYQLTVAVSANKNHYNLLNLKEMNRYVDAWHLMAYDYSGSWSQVTSHQAGVFIDSSDPNTTDVATDPALQDYMEQGVPAAKIVLGLPLYGRVFQNTDGLGYSFDNSGSETAVQTATNSRYLYNQLMDSDAEVHVDKNVMAAWTYNTTSRELISFDNAETTKLKAQYLDINDLAGAMFWDASGDKPGTDSLVRTMAENMGDLDDTENMLDYPLSPWKNIRE